MSKITMHETTTATLRFWAVAECLYGFLVSALVLFLIPWKTPWLSAVFLLYGVFHLLSGVGLYLKHRWGVLLSISSALIGIVSALLLVAALIGTASYLWGIFGDFGLGASVGAILFASTALQVLGLYSGTKLRSLLRRELRRDFNIGKGIFRLLVGGSFLPLLFLLFFSARFSLPSWTPLTEEQKQQALTYAQNTIDGQPPVEMSALEGVETGALPLYLTLYSHGIPAFRTVGEGADLAKAVADAAAKLADQIKNSKSIIENGRLKFDRVVAQGPVLSNFLPVLALSVNPGLDGLRRKGAPPLTALLPDDLLQKELFGAVPFVPGIEELRLGLNAQAALGMLPDGPARIERFRTESWVAHKGKALSVTRGNTPPRRAGPSAWRRAAILGGEFILRQIRADGRFFYRYGPIQDEHRDGRDYSLPRHAGTIYSLALLYGYTHDDRFWEGASSAIDWLVRQKPRACGQEENACIAKGRSAWLGSTALTVVAMLEYQRKTGDDFYQEHAQRLLNFLLFMQKENGDFHHRYNLRKNRIDKHKKKMFYSEEAALALVMGHDVLDDMRYLKAARRALDYLTGPKYDAYFLGKFIYGADHWTCIAAEEAWPRIKSKQYWDFCRGYADFMGRLQYKPGEWTNKDFEGHYGFGAFMVPQAPAAAGFTEAIISTYKLSEHYGEPDETLKRQVSFALDALARDQIRSENSWLMKRPAYAMGGIRRSLVEPEVRIDFTQHAASALIRGTDL